MYKDIIEAKEELKATIDKTINEAVLTFYKKTKIPPASVGIKVTPFFQDIEDELFSLEKEFGTEKFNLLGRDPETMEIALNNASDTELVVINCEMDGAVFKYKGKEIGSVKAPEEVRSLLKEHKLI